MIDPRLPAFLESIATAPLEAVADEMARMVVATGGFWMAPPPPDWDESPGTHLIEISLFNHTGRGMTLREAVDSWRLAAIATLEGAARDTAA